MRNRLGIFGYMRALLLSDGGTTFPQIRVSLRDKARMPTEWLLFCLTPVPRIESGLRAQNPLTAGEAIKALDLLLGLRDLKVIQREAGASLELVLQPDGAERDAH